MPKSIKTQPLVLQEKAAFQRRLLSWYTSAARKLPWRSKPSLYKTVVSEFMLQQTQVETVLPYFERWLKVFPDFKTLAQASGDAVLKQWEGLGYYSRARNLHQLAQTLSGLTPIPKNPEFWLKLPGIGPYTAAAITSICFGEPAAVVDGNVIRVISRLIAEPAVFKDNGQAAKQLKPVAESLLSRRQPGDYNQAMMELGATVCIRNKPRCLICPVRPLCAAFTQSNPETFPRLQKKSIEQVQVERLWVVRKESLLLQRAPKEARRLSDIYELPLKQILGNAKEGLFLKAVRRRAISNQSIEERIFTLVPSPAQARALSQESRLAWVPFGRLDAVILSGPHRRWIAEWVHEEK